MQYDPNDLKPRERYKVLTSFVLPRPIAWVTSIGPAGVVNAAPFSFFNAMGADNHAFTPLMEILAELTEKIIFAEPLLACSSWFFTCHVNWKWLARAQSSTRTGRWRSATIDAGSPGCISQRGGVSGCSPIAAHAATAVTDASSS